MIDIKRALNNPRMMTALTGLTPKEFKDLIPSYLELWQKTKLDKYLKELDSRQRQPGGGRTGFLKTIEEKLFYILFYYKCYPTFDLVSFFYHCNRSNACRRVAQLSQILERTLGKKLVLPKRQILTPEEFFQAFPEAKEIFIDGTERPIQRPKDNARQKSNYSGKKKRHTKKNIVVCDINKHIGFLGQTTAGKEHDLSILKTETIVEHIPEGVRSHFDLGFQGIQKEYPSLNAILPKKKPRGEELTDNEKEQNTAKSRMRILVENAIGGAKRLGIISNIFRNKRKLFDDQVMFISCGLWNYHLAQIT